MNPPAARTPRRQINPWLIAPVVALAAFMEVLDISIANVALPHIAGNLSASLDESAWVLTSYLVTNAILMPISGWVSTMMGRKRFFMTCIVGFTLTSLLCGMAPNLGALVLLRALQGAAGGGLQPSGQAILTDTFPPKQRGMAFALYGLATVVAPAIGPTLGGWITDNISWRWVFLINVPVGLLLIALIYMLIEDPQHLVEERARALARGIRFDYIGFGLVSLGLGCLQIVLDRGQEDDWFSSSAILTLSIICVLSIVCLIITQLTRDDPIVDLRLLKDRTFAISSLLMFLLGFVLLGSTFLIPAYVQEMLGYTATDAGLVITPGGLGLLLLMPFIGRLVSRVDVRVMILVGLGLCSAALLLMTNFDLNTNYTYIMLLRMLQAAGLGFLFIPINTAAFSSLPKEKTNNASGLINLWRNLGGSIGISVASTILARHQQYHHSVLAEHMRVANPAFTHMKQTLTQYMHHALGVPGTEHAYAVMGQMLDVQARMLSYLDAFYLFGLVFVLLIPTLLLMKMPKHVEAVAGH